MAKDKKNQHYVPECYLENWTTHQDRNQVCVYDKKNRNSFCTNINNIVAERYFYDINFKEIFNEKDYERFGISLSELEELENDQLIENYLSEFVEGNYKTFLRNKINRINNMNTWELENCYFISENERYELSVYMAIQMIRGKSLRNTMENISDVVGQMLIDVGASSETIKKYTSSPSEMTLIQGEMILDMDTIAELVEALLNKFWVLYFNKTNQPFYTSDNPIARIPHKKHPFESNAGLNSEGIEILFPLSPNMVLAMYDCTYHTYTKPFHKKIEVIDEIKTIDWINMMTTINSERWIISQNDTFSTAQEIVNREKNVKPPVELHYNGKVYKANEKDQLTTKE